MRKIISFILYLHCILQLSAATPARSNQVRFNHLTVQDGLSNSTVFSIVQDNAGFMWFATLDGLNRFDGVNFRIYRPVKGDTTSVADLGIKNLYSDKNGRLWIALAGGKLDRYDPQNDCFIHYRLAVTKTADGEAGGYISFTEDSAGKFWAASSGGWLFGYDDIHDRFFLRGIYKESGQDGEVFHPICLYPDKNNNIWIGSRDGSLFKYAAGENKIKYIRKITGENENTEDALQSITADAKGCLWIATEESGLFVYDTSRNSITTYRNEPGNPNCPAGNKLYCIFTDSRNNIWLGFLQNGLGLFEQKKKRFYNYPHIPEIPWSLSDDVVLCFFEDSGGCIWIGTYYGGVNRIDLRRQSFEHWGDDRLDTSGFGSHSVLAICADHTEILWIGTDGGGLFRRPAGKSEFENVFGKPGELSSQCVTALLEDLAGNIWIGTDIGDIFIYKRNQNRLVRFDRISRDCDGILTFFQDSFGYIWIGTVQGGLFCYFPQKKELLCYRHDKNKAGGISGNFIYSVFEDRQGTIWVGTRKAGINRFDRSDESFTCFDAVAGVNNTLSDNTIFFFYEDRQENLWMGTWGGGLNRFNRQDSSSIHFTTQNGLPGNIIYSGIPDKNGNLWLSTNRGLAKFNLNTFACKKYDHSDGLLNFEFNQGAYFQGADGCCYFGGSKGITVFNPDSVTENTHIPPIVLTSFKVFDKPFPLKSSLDMTEKITLSYRQNFFTFEFAALDYSAPERNEYAYMLEGVDKNWIKAGNRKMAGYTDIAPGNYIFRVKGCNNDGAWNEQGKSTELVITPPYWQTWWFRGIVLFSITLFLYALYRYRLNKLLEIERTRLRISRDLHDQVSSTLTGIAFFSGAIEEELKNNKSSTLKKLITHITDSIKDAQESMADIIWSINPQNDDWEIILPRFRRYALDLCECNNITCKTSIPESIAIRAVNMERQHNLWLIFKEMVTNAVKHSACSELDIFIELKNKEFYLMVADNGNGFDSLQRSEGNGLKNIQLRTAALKGAVNLSTAPGKGTCWELTVPL